MTLSSCASHSIIDGDIVVTRLFANALIQNEIIKQILKKLQKCRNQTNKVNNNNKKENITNN